MEIRKLSKKGQIGGLGTAVIAMVIAGVFLILGLVMLQEFRDADIMVSGELACNATDMTGCVAYNDANATIVGLASFADFWEIMVLAVVISVVIGLLLTVFGRRAGR